MLHYSIWNIANTQQQLSCRRNYEGISGPGRAKRKELQRNLRKHAEDIKLFFILTCLVGLQVHRKPQFNQTVHFEEGEFYIHQLNLKMTVLNVMYLEKQENSLMT